MLMHGRQMSVAKKEKETARPNSCGIDTKMQKAVQRPQAQPAEGQKNKSD